MSKTSHRPRGSLRRALVVTAGAALAFSWAGAGLSFADSVSMTNDPSHNLTIADGGSATFTVRLVAQNGSDVAGCNANSAFPVTIAFASQALWATTDVDHVTMTDCSTPQYVQVFVAQGTATQTTGAHTKIVGTASGGTTATVEIVDHGPKGSTTTTTETVYPTYSNDFINVNVPMLGDTNTAPVAMTQALDVNGLEGQTLTTSGVFTDDGGTDPSNLRIEQTSGAGSITLGSNGSWTWSLPTDDDGSGTVVVRATDAQGLSSEDAFDWSAANVAPTVGPVSLTRNGPCAVGLSATFSDPGTADTHTASIAWGDEALTGADPTVGNVEDATPVAGAGVVTGQHNYPTAGTYIADVTVTDDDGGSDTESASPFKAYNTPSAILQPINASGTRSSFKIGSTIPVKITITGCDGNPNSSLTPSVNLEQTDTTADTAVNESSVSETPTNGKLMRWDAAGAQYIYNLSTKLSQFTGAQLTAGTWTVSVNDPTFEKPVKAAFDLRK